LNKDIEWFIVLFLSSYHILLPITLFWYISQRGWPSLGMWVALVTLIFLIGMGVTAGYHRFYAHKAYKIAKPIEVILLFFGTLAAENSAMRWAHNHRMHHIYTDTDKDPYSIKKGFWYAHILCTFKKVEPIDKRIVQDLQNNRLVAFQHRYYNLLYILGNTSIIVFIGYFLNDFFGAFVFCYLLRTFLIHHSTFFVNSLAHTWGAVPYTKEVSAVDNYAVALLTLGEGYHNYHHAFASDYRNGIKWYHFDPTKWVIWTLSKLGLAKNLISFSKYTIKRRMINEDKKFLLENIKKSLHTKKMHFEKRIQEMANKVTERLDVLRKSREEYLQGKKASLAKERIYQLKKSFKSNKKLFMASWNDWKSIVKSADSGFK